MSTPPAPQMGAAPDGHGIEAVPADLFQATLAEFRMQAADDTAPGAVPCRVPPAPQLGAYGRAHADLAMQGLAPGVAAPLAGGGPAAAPGSGAQPGPPWTGMFQGSPLLQLLAQAAGSGGGAAVGGQYLWPQTPAKAATAPAFPAAWQPASPAPLTLAPLPPITPAAEPLPQEAYSSSFAAGLPGLSYHDGTPLRPRRKVRSKARILAPGALTMIVYGADEATRWEERVAGFLAAVRGVLGCRQLDAAHWRCSVLDSVIGTFLTQNVTDALSSKAFMTLAARFPAPPLAAAAGEGGAGEAAAGDARLTCQDSIDWQAVLRADPEQVADAVKCRGMYDMLARRIQALLSLIGSEGRPSPRLRPLPPAPALRQLPCPAQSSREPQTATASDRRQAGSSRLAAGSSRTRAGASLVEQAEAAADAGERPAAAPVSPDAAAAGSSQDSASPLQPETPRQAASQPQLRQASAELGGAASPERAAAAVGSEVCQTPSPKKLKSDEVRRSLYQTLGSAADEPPELIATPRKADTTTARPFQPAAEAEALPGGSSQPSAAAALPEAGGAAAAEQAGSTKFPLELEWLWGTDTDEAREHLMGIEGLGRKSAACILLLALKKKDFPVDTNVGRICARLGWLPLDAEKALEDLDDYAPEPEVHAYLKDRLMRFDVPLLYELHYHMITLGKVFCSKKDPNCSACPLQRQCEYARSNGRKRQPTAAPTGAEQSRHASGPASAAQQLRLPGADAAAAAGTGPATGAVASQRQLPAAQQAAQHQAEGLWSEAAESAADGTQPLADGAAARQPQSSQELRASAAVHDAAAAAQLPAAAPDELPGCSSPAQEQRPAEPDETTQDMEDLCSQPKADAAAEGFMRLLAAAAPLRELTSAPDQGQSTARAVEAAQQAMGLAADASGADAGAPAGPSAAAARKRFLELSALTHPDKCSHPQAEEAFAALKLAHSVLQDHLASQAPVGRSADGFYDAKALRSVSIRDSSTRVAVEAWEIPAAEWPRLVGSLAEGTLASDHPFLLIHIPKGTVLPAPDEPAEPQAAGPSQAQPAAAQAPLQPTEAASRPEADAAAAAAELAGSEDRQPLPEAAGLASSSEHGRASSAQQAAGSSAAGASPTEPESATGGPEPPGTRAAQGAGQQPGAGDAAASPEAAGQAAPAPRVSQGHFALLVPCRLAMRGRFPLHGTYFQTNEVFLDHGSLCGPGIQVAEEEVAGWPQRQVLFGSSVGSICRGMSQLEVACVFRRACICVRAYEPASGLPRLLPACLNPRGHEAKASPTKWRPKAKRSLAAIAAFRVPSFRVPSFRTTAGGKRLRDDGLVLWGAARLRTALVGKRPLRPSPEEAAARKRQRLEHGPRMGGGPRRGSTLPSGIRHLLPPAMASQDARALEALLRSKAGPDDGRRRHLLPNVSSSQRCGHCKSCLNRAMKKACYTRRAELLQTLMAESSAAAAAAPAEQAAEPAEQAAEAAAFAA